MKQPWYLTNSGVLGGLAIQLTFWFACVTTFMWLTLPSGEGVIIGHIIAIGCTLFGFPARLLLDD